MPPLSTKAAEAVATAAEDSAAKRRAEGYLALVVVQVFFGLFPLFVKMATDPAGGLSPRALAVWRIVFGSVVLLSFALAREGRRALPRRADVPRLLLCGLFGVVLNQVLALEGVARTSIVQAGILMTLIPVFTYALAVLVRQEVFRARRAVGILIALVGAALLIVARSGGEVGGGDTLGNVLIVSNCLFYAGYLILARPLLRHLSAQAMIGWVFVASTWTLPLVAWGEDLVPDDLTAQARWGAALTLIFPTALAYFLNTYALARVSASTTAVFIYFQPLVAGAAGVFLWGESVGASVGLAAGLLFAGIWLVTRTRAVRPRAR